MAELDVEQYRKRLLGVAYRILGSVSDAEDAVQDTFLRWHRHSGSGDSVQSPEAWLVTVVTRLCIDRVRALKRERDLYSGPWLPEPIGIHDASSPERNTEVNEDLSLAFLALLQRLTEEERAALVLRNILGYSYEEVSRILDKSQEASRQLVHRGRRNLRHGAVKKCVSASEKERIVRSLLTAIESGDESTVLRLLAPDVAWTSDGGGKVAGIAPHPIHGVERVGRMLIGIARKVHGFIRADIIQLVGEAALAFWYKDQLYGVWTVDVAGEHIIAFNTVFNPDKLGHLKSGSSG